ncbi:MAG TPA: MmcQ/YjbR family DNA-binding protein [Usitatibacter sp.]|nr:MmcQ/YjbR family DNA-binding protein [Usitatibacter sp.]
MPAKKASRIAAAIRKQALSYPQVTEEFPWGESAFKVHGRTFVFMRDAADGVSFSVKVPESRDLALSLPGAEPTHYGLGSKGWVTIVAGTGTPLHVLEFLVDESYRAMAPKRVIAKLAEPPRLYP